MVSKDLEQLKDSVTGDIEALEREAEMVYLELVLPRWGSADYHGFPRTLYGYVMASFSIVDLLSRCRYSDASQTRRMRNFLKRYLGASAEAAAVAVQLWRHTLMHTANPQTLIDPASGRTYRWLLHWREHLPREQHMQFQQVGAGAILNVGLLYLVDDLGDGARAAFADAENSSSLRARFLSASQDLSIQQVRV